MLNQLRELLSDPDRWTKNTMARDAEGTSCGPNQPQAQCFCLMGGINRVTLDHFQRDEMMEALEAGLIAKTNGRFDLVMDFNDDPETTHADVLALIDFTISH